MRISRFVVASSAVGLAIVWTACSSSSTPAPQPSASPAKSETAPAAPVPLTPAMLAGNWLVEMKMGTRTVEGSLHFALTSGVLVGTFTRSDGAEQELKDITIKGNEVAWDIEAGGGKQHSRGTVDGTSMKGTVKRSGARRGGQRGGGGSPDGETGDGDRPSNPSDGGAPPEGSGGGGSYGGRHGGGRRGGGGGGRGGSGSSEITFVAYKSVPPVEVTGTPPTASPTPAH